MIQTKLLLILFPLARVVKTFDDIITSTRQCAYAAMHFFPDDDEKQNEITFKFCAKSDWPRLLESELSRSENVNSLNNVLHRGRRHEPQRQCQEGCQRRELLIDWNELEKRLFQQSERYTRHFPDLKQEYMKSYGPNDKPPAGVIWSLNSRSSRNRRKPRKHHIKIGTLNLHLKVCE